MNKRAHAFERPQFGLKAICAGLVQQRACQLLELPGLQTRGPPRRGHVSKRINAAFIENFFPYVHRLSGHARGVCDLGRFFAFLQQPSGANALF